MALPLKNILALDLGTHYGWALRTQDGITSGNVNLSAEARKQNHGFRYLSFEKQLHEIHQTAPLDAIFYEEVRAHSSVGAAHVYGGFSAVLFSFCDHNGIAYSSVPVGEIKKTATADGTATKKGMLRATQQYLPTVTDDNEADAFWILITGLTHYLGEPNTWTNHIKKSKGRGRKGSAV
jgi:Holliday junction resolvasome RuvABC endonuclease subunit